MVIELSGVQFGVKAYIHVISKSNKRAARVRFEITSMISDQIARPEVSFLHNYHLLVPYSTIIEGS